MTYPTEEQEALMRKNGLNPEHWMVYKETRKTLIVLCKRKSKRKVLKKEIEE